MALMLECANLSSRTSTKGCDLLPSAASSKDGWDRTGQDRTERIYIYTCGYRRNYISTAREDAKGSELHLWQKGLETAP